MRTAEYWIQHLNLQSHEEGGYFAEVFKSNERIPKEALPGDYAGDRTLATSIYFLITPHRFSSFHRLKSDEIWHFYDGYPIEIIMIMPNGALEKLVLGNDPASGARLQGVVPAGCWFGARPIQADKDVFALVGCTVVPGFEYEDFELADRKELIQQYPAHKTLIHELTY